MNKQWESDVLKQAMAACLEGNMSIYAAAKEYNVPRANKFVTACQGQRRRRMRRLEQPGRPKALSTDEDNSFYIKYMHTIWSPSQAQPTLYNIYPTSNTHTPLESFTVCVQCKSKQICIMMILKGSSMPKAEHDLRAIMYPAYGTHHRLRTIRGNKIQLTQNRSEW